jgi:hypothetical protein
VNVPRGADRETAVQTSIRHLAAGALLTLAAGAASAANVTVNYIQPQNFSDLPSAPWERERALEGIAAHFVKLGAKLPPGQNLRVDVVNIDLAGSEYQSRARTDLRVMSRGQWPRIDLHYTLESNGQVVGSGDAQLRDTAYLDRPNRYVDHDTVRFEKRMVDTWFDRTILAGERGAGR